MDKRLLFKKLVLCGTAISPIKQNSGRNIFHREIVKKQKDNAVIITNW